VVFNTRESQGRVSITEVLGCWLNGFTAVAFRMSGRRPFLWSGRHAAMTASGVSHPSQIVWPNSKFSTRTSNPVGLRMLLFL